MIELATSAMMLFSLVYGVAGAATKPVDTTPSNNTQATNNLTIVDAKALSAPIGGMVSIESEVRTYFDDTPILAEIARCESGFRQLNSNGEILRGEVNPADIGVMQINTDYHSKEANAKGIDLKTFGGNMKFARVLYDKFGTSPWKASSACWQKFDKIAKS